jgi:hypothetical protein
MLMLSSVLVDENSPIDAAGLTLMNILTARVRLFFYFQLYISKSFTRNADGLQNMRIDG